MSKLNKVNNWLDRLNQEKYALYNNWRNSDEGQQWKLKKFTIQDGKCKDCSKSKEIEEMEIDHIKAISRGGHPFEPNNLQLLCHMCNKKKSNN